MTLGASQLAGDPDGYELDMQATWYPTGQSPAKVVFPTQPDRVNGNKALVNVGCDNAPCDGTVTLTGPPVATVAKASMVTYASGTFTLAAGASGTVPATLTSNGTVLARTHARLKVTIAVKLTNLSPVKTFSRTVELRF
jgi:hypothetical protein